MNLKNMVKDYKKRKYKIVPYDPMWKERFVNESRLLRSIFGRAAIAIEHVGSTAVPGLSGKSTIDVLIVVKDIAVADSLNSEMVAAGYKVLGEYVKPGARFFVKERNDVRLFHVHVFPKDHPHVKEMLLLRDYFRSHEELVEEYTKLKLKLYSKYPDNYASYRKYKDEWMEELKEKIRKGNILDK